MSAQPQPLHLPTVEETLGHLNHLLDSGVRAPVVKSPLGNVHGACQMAAKLLGHKTPALGRPSAGHDATVFQFASAAGLVAREIALTGDWWEFDHGVFIGMLEEGERVVLVKPGKGRFPMAYCEVGVSGDFLPLTDVVARGMRRVATALYPLLPDRALVFRDIVARPWATHRFEVLVYVALSIAIALLTYAVPVASGMIIDKAVPYRDVPILAAIIAVVVASNLMMLLLRYLGEIVVNRAEGSVSTDVQAGFLERVFRQPMKFLSGYNKADLMRRFTALEGARRAVTRMLVSGGMALVTFVVGLGVLALHYPLGSLSVGLLGLVSLALAYVLGKRSIQAYAEGDAMTANVLTIVYELIGNMLPIRIFGAERRSFLRWRDNFVEMRRRTVHSTRYSDLFAAIQQSMGLLTLGLMFALVVYATDSTQPSTVGEYVAFVGSISIVTGSVGGLASAILSWFSLKVSVNLAEPVLAQVPEPAAGCRRLQISDGAFELKAVDFRYADDSLPVLQDFSLSIPGGQYLGVVGASGCGKSTLMKLLLGLHKPTGGSVHLDGTDLADVVMEDVRKSFGVVLQDYRMVPGSILDNITAGRDLDLESVMTALKQVGLEILIKSLPMGVHTVMGEGNSLFSGGQTQLMALARALVGEPKLLIIDEATSALDNMSLQRVGNVIDELAITRIVFTHRLGTLKHCDHIVVLEQGVLVQQGHYNALATAAGPFKTLLTGKVT